MSQDNYDFMKNMLDTLVYPISCKDKNGIYLAINEIFARQVFGLPEEEIIGYTLPEVARKVVERFPDRAFVNETFLLEHVIEWNKCDIELLKHGGASTREYEGICADGIKKILVNKSTFNNKNGEIAGLVTVLQDITEIKESEMALKENLDFQVKLNEQFQRSEERYRIIAEQTGQLVYDYDLKTDKGNWAGNIEKITGYSSQEFEELSSKVWIEHIIHPADRERITKRLSKFRKKGGNYREEFRLKRKDGTYFQVEDSGVYLIDKSGQPYRALGVMKDITEQKLAQQKIQQSEKRYRSFIENFKGIAFQADENFIPQFLHGAVEEITGYSEEEFMSSELYWIDIIDPEYLPIICEKKRKLREFPDSCVLEVEYRIISRNGETKWVHETCQKISGTDGNHVYQCVIYDITERKKVEEALVNIETARKKEIYHRIKNNLQVISSLLDLQAEKFSDKECIKKSEVLEAFRESRDRVLSIALIHEELHEGKGEEALNFSLYLEKLVKNLLHTYILGNTAVSLNIDLEENVFFDMNIAVPLGMIVNELVSNSLKYAFPNRETGDVQIKLFSEKTGDKLDNNEDKLSEKSTRYTFIVSDNGVGIPETIDIKNSETLGLQLVSILVDQLDGTIELKRDAGTEFIVKFTTTEKP